jgi:hypothetical protein
MLPGSAKPVRATTDDADMGLDIPRSKATQPVRGTRDRPYTARPGPRVDSARGNARRRLVEFTNTDQTSNGRFAILCVPGPSSASFSFARGSVATGR